MKHIKKQIEKERKQMLEEDNFAEDVLYPIADNNTGDIGHVRIKSKKLLYITISALLLVMVLSLLISFIYLDSSGYSKTYEVRTATLSEVNDCLASTHLLGDYALIMLTYEIKNEIPMCFVLSYEEAWKTKHVFCRFDVIVNSEYPYEHFDVYNDSFNFLGYTVETRMTVESEPFEDETVTIFTINAVMDTSAEKYMIHYEEITLSGQCGFNDYLESSITIKQ